MTNDQLEALTEKFDAYCRSFYSSSEEDQRNVLLKQFHTAKVVENMSLIVDEAFADESSRTAARAIALCHDIGRFPQYRTYGTFKDSESVNHAALGATVLLENGFLEDLHPPERDLVVAAVRFHNVFTIPSAISPAVIPYLKLVRDADKLDIWRVFIDYFNLPAEERASAAGLGFSDDPTCTVAVTDQVQQGRMVQLSTVRTLDDFKLLQLSWVFDLNYRSSLRLAAERDYLLELAATLPRSAEIDRAVSSIFDYLQRRIKEYQV